MKGKWQYDLNYYFIELNILFLISKEKDKLTNYI